MSEQGVTYTQIDVDCGGWECSGCKGIWSLSDGTPKENDMSFCPFCGKPIVGVKAWADPEDDQLSRTITFTDEDGNECAYLFVDSFEVGGKTYAVLAEAERTCDICKHKESPRDQHPCSSCYTLTAEQWEPSEDFEPAAFLMRLDLVDGDEVFCPLDDDEREAAEAEWKRICEEDDEEATLV